MKPLRQVYDPNAAGSCSKTRSLGLITQIQSPSVMMTHVELVHTLALVCVLELQPMVKRKSWDVKTVDMKCHATMAKNKGVYK